MNAVFVARDVQWVEVSRCGLQEARLRELKPDSTCRWLQSTAPSFCVNGRPSMRLVRRREAGHRIRDLSGC
ncbi:hypothetical protein [Corallococcus macrosporus]|uniref:hypothetical protein n=1 Tax=Corallococcus macrosporus TaxID=35 RepID=UPI001A8D640B|nr:hypothetical protein [Corallococcus macrosporus]